MIWRTIRDYLAIAWGYVANTANAVYQWATTSPPVAKFVDAILFLFGAVVAGVNAALTCFYRSVNAAMDWVEGNAVQFDIQSYLAVSGVIRMMVLLIATVALVTFMVGLLRRMSGLLSNDAAFRTNVRP